MDPPGVRLEHRLRVPAVSVAGHGPRLVSAAHAGARVRGHLPRGGAAQVRPVRASRQRPHGQARAHTAPAHLSWLTTPPSPLHAPCSPSPSSPCPCPPCPRSRLPILRLPLPGPQHPCPPLCTRLALRSPLPSPRAFQGSPFWRLTRFSWLKACYFKPDVVQPLQTHSSRALKPVLSSFLSLCITPSLVSLPLALVSELCAPPPSPPLRAG